ncbi:hypothetical protein ABI59_12185 [Acidobacteria bacterium Mor1]|nr:hypothetical protein ABI59_12185 [Acidobacteria bacterium Mor1]
MAESTRLIRCALALLGLLFAAAGPAVANEIWVVNENSRDIVILEANTESIIDFIDLTAVQDDPYDVAFTTVPGIDGNIAFVTQGELVVLVDVPSRTPFNQVDVSNLLGLTAQVRGAAAARPRAFLDGGGGEVTRNLLYVAAQVINAAGFSEPWFVVLDQDVMVADPSDPAVLVQAGPLETTQPGQVLEVMDVDVLSTPAGDRFQRAWFTHLEEAPSIRLVATLVAAKRDIAAPIQPVEVRDEQLGLPSLPDSVTVGVPYDRELPALPLAEEGRVVNLDTGGDCEIPSSNLRDVATAGLGPGSHTVLLANDGAPGRIEWLDPSTCASISFPAQDEPVDIAFDNPIEWNRAFVANRNSDSITLLRVDQSQTTIPLPGGTSPCTLCPRSVVANLGLQGSCTVRDFEVNPDPTSGGADSIISWNLTGCDSEPEYLVACVCEDPSSPLCPPGCGQSTLTPGANAVSSIETLDLALEAGGPLCDGEWKPLHSTGPGDTDYTVPGGGTGLGVCYSVTPRQGP